MILGSDLSGYNHVQFHGTHSPVYMMQGQLHCILGAQSCGRDSSVEIIE